VTPRNGAAAGGTTGLLIPSPDPLRKPLAAAICHEKKPGYITGPNFGKEKIDHATRDTIRGRFRRAQHSYT